MPQILMIETATEKCSVALSFGKEIVAKAEAIKNFDHSARLTLLIEQCLQAAGTGFDQLDALALSAGPGSYTGLRVGMATAKGICFGTDLPLILIPTLEILAQAGISAMQNQKAYYLPMLDARRMEVYAALYNASNQSIQPTDAYILEKNSFQQWQKEDIPVFYFGSGSSKWAEICELDNFYYWDVSMSAVDMLNSAYVKYMAKDFSSIISAAPLYLKNPNITTPKPKLTY